MPHHMGDQNNFPTMNGPSARTMRGVVPSGVGEHTYGPPPMQQPNSNPPSVASPTFRPNTPGGQPTQMPNRPYFNQNVRIRREFEEKTRRVLIGNFPPQNFLIKKTFSTTTFPRMTFPAMTFPTTTLSHYNNSQ